jgi:hypothetical protein
MWDASLPCAGLCWTELEVACTRACLNTLLPPLQTTTTQDEGKGMSIWDAFSHTPGKISGNASGDISTCHFYR